MGVKLKTINAEEAAYEGFRQLAKECGLTSPELVSTMVQYFRVTKADPRYPTGPDLTTSLAKIVAKLADLDKRTIGFIREQEKQYLKPILAEVQAYKVLNTPPANVSMELSKAQIEEVGDWFLAMLRMGLPPTHLSNLLISSTLPPALTKDQQDPVLTSLKRRLLEIFRLAINPELLPPTMRPDYKPPTPGAVNNAAPASTPLPSTTKPA